MSPDVSRRDNPALPPPARESHTVLWDFGQAEPFTSKFPYAQGKSRPAVEAQLLL